MNQTTCEIKQGCNLEILPTLQAKSVQAIVTSPPYFGLRDYGIPGSQWPEITFAPLPGMKPINVPAWQGCLGNEAEPTAFIAHMVHVFRLARRVLRDDGTLWLNLGDSYSAGNGIKTKGAQTNITSVAGVPVRMARGTTPSDGRAILSRSFAKMPKPKDLIGIPWRAAFALQTDGWYLRQDIIWHKPNPMPESVTDRCTKAHEYVFLLTKSERYFYDAEAVSEPLSGPAHAPGNKASTEGGHMSNDFGTDAMERVWGASGRRNKRSVWTVATQPYSGAHFATFPPKLIEPCILAGSRTGDTVLDPFGGSGTTAEVANEHGRNAVVIEINETYQDLIRDRNQQSTMAF